MTPWRNELIRQGNERQGSSYRKERVDRKDQGRKEKVLQEGTEHAEGGRSLTTDSTDELK